MTDYVTPNIHTVLKKYQTSAPKSLQGPGISLNSSTLSSPSSATASATSQVIAQATTNCPCPLDVSLNNGGGTSSLVQEMHGLVTMRNSPCDLIKTGANLQVPPQPSSSLSTTASSININPALPLIKKEIMTSPEPAPTPHDLPLEQPILGSSLQGPPPSSIKILAPPPPEVSQPILSAADSGSGELYETRLEAKTIGCFSLGGEMRLCLPQFLNNVLAEFSLEQINRSFDDLGIFCSQCTPDQLMEFKAAKILPSDVKSSGLITRTDAERLCAVLLHRSDRNSYINVEDIPKGALSFKVYHRCFGKCEGICTPDMYSYQKPTCIMCLECKGWFSPQKFVGHVHRKMENRTCHWGFDSRNWHDYLHVALDVENREKYQKILDELKEVEFKEQLKAQQEINYLKRKAELHMDHSILVPSMGLGAPPQLPHQPLAPSIVKHRGGEQLDIPTTKKLKSLDEASAYHLEYQHYQSLVYAHCAQQQRMAAGQMSAFRQWPQPKNFMHAAYNAAAVAALSTLPYLSQEPPVLQNPERVVRSTDRERFERTYQPNVALAPRKTHLSQEREKEQREIRERERIEREREREMERIRDRERSREREYERERERDLRDREMQKKLQVPQQQQHVQIKQQPISAMCEAEVHIKQERAPTPAEMSCTPPPALSNHIAEERRTSSGPMDEDPHPTTPLISPMSLSRSNKHLNHMELQTRRLSLHNSNSSATSSSSSSASSTTPTNLTNSSATPPQPQLPAQIQKQQPAHHPPPPVHLQRIPPIHHGPVHGPQPYIRQSPSPHHGHCNNASCTNPRSPEEFGGSNEITSSTSPLPQQQQLQHQQQPIAQTIIATVNHHNKPMPSSGNFVANNNNNSNVSHQQQHNDMTGRIRISKNLLNQNNIMRSPTPTPPPPSSQHHAHHNNHQSQQQQQQQQQHLCQQQAGPQIQQQQQPILAAQNYQQQHYDYYKQNQRFFQQQHHPQLQQQQQLRNHNSQPNVKQQQHSPSQSSNVNTPTGLNLTTNLTNTNAATTAVTLQQSHDNNNGKAHLRTPQAIMIQHHLQNGRRSQAATTMNSEFELSTDTDDESVNDGEADSSNTLTPWELAIETLRDSRPKDRERLLNMLQRILNENQHYRLQNQQLKELIEVRNEQISKLQTELHHCQRQLENLQLNPLPSVINGSGSNNGLITKALRKECADNQMILRVPLKKSQRREPEMYEREFREDRTQSECEERLQRQCDESIQYNLSQIKRELNESMEEDEEVEEEDDEDSTTTTTSPPEQKTFTDRSQHQVESSQQKQERENESASESEQEEEQEDADDQEEDSNQCLQSMSSTQQENRSHKEEIHQQHRVIENLKNEKESLENQPDDQEDDNVENDVENEDEEDKEEEEEVQALHTNTLSAPPTATTPLSPDSAATAGQLFDSSNSSDESSMKKAQMSASNALAIMNSETNDDDDEQEEEQEDNDIDETHSNAEKSNNEDTEAEEEEDDPAENHLQHAKHFRSQPTTATTKALSSNTNTINIINTSINQTPPNTTTVVLATKASKKLTPTTNNDIIIKQEYL